MSAIGDGLKGASRNPIPSLRSAIGRWQVATFVVAVFYAPYFWRR
ncbi:MAG: hypothetical protein XFASWVDF_000212 [Candidatus Fervidibacter sp.]|jgi:hypothetical protein